MQRIALLSTLFLTTLSAQIFDPLQLPPPRTDGGKPLMQALKLRRSTREFAEKDLSRQMLSDLLWAGFGVNRDDGKRTAPSAFNHQGIDIYVFTREGVYLYAAAEHSLKPVLAGDHRALTAPNDFAKQAAVSLVYVADHSRSERTRVWMKPLYAGFDTGFIGQNVYLFCASAGLGTVIHDGTPDGALAAKLELRRDQ
ncbi:MAG: SagB/ThcOx family dehydrogenase, partial [bacterium]|nr:SagB/ThcOx family dehydrogenase [bacterium]